MRISTLCVLWSSSYLIAMAAVATPAAAQEPKLRAVLGEGHTHGRGGTSLTWSPDGKRIAALDHDGTVRLWDVASSSNIATFVDPASKVVAMRFSPDGRTLTMASLDGTIRKLDAAGTAEAGKVPLGKATNVALAPDRKTLAWRGGDNVVHVWDFDQAGEKYSFTVQKSQLGLLATLSPDPAKPAPVISSVPSPLNAVHDAATGKSRFTAIAPPAPVFSDDGKFWAMIVPPIKAGGTAATLELRDVITPNRTIRKLGSFPNCAALALSPDGKLAAACRADRFAKGFQESSVVALVNTESGETKELRLGGRSNSGEVCVAAAFSPDGKFLAVSYSESGIVIRDVATRQTVATLKRWEPQVASFALHPGGKLLAAASPPIPTMIGKYNGPTIPPTVRLIDLTTNQQIAFLDNCGDPELDRDCVAALVGHAAEAEEIQTRFREDPFG